MTVRSAIANETNTKGLEDLSTAHRALRFQGPGAIRWLASRGVACPDTLFGVSRYGEERSAVLVAKVGSHDLILQAAVDSEALEALERAPCRDAGVFQVPEQAATLRLSEPQAGGVWRQTCALPLHTRPCDVVVYTRVAGVSCAVIPEERSAKRSYRIWVDYSYAPDLWRSMTEILAEPSVA